MIVVWVVDVGGDRVQEHFARLHVVQRDQARDVVRGHGPQAHVEHGRLVAAHVDAEVRVGERALAAHLPRVERLDIERPTSGAATAFLLAASSELVAMGSQPQALLGGGCLKST